MRKTLKEHLKNPEKVFQKCHLFQAKVIYIGQVLVWSTEQGRTIEMRIPFREDHAQQSVTIVPDIRIITSAAPSRTIVVREDCEEISENQEEGQEFKKILD